MSERKLDEILAELRAEQPPEELQRDAARRVFRNVFDAAYLPERTAPVGRITGCVDFQALIPTYLDGGLGASRVSLLEDHVSECVECRRALHDARAGNRRQESPAIVRFARPAKKRVSLLPWAVAATLAVGVALGITGALNGLLPGQHAVRATVKTVQGTLYTVSDLGSSLVKAGTLIHDAEELRTAKGSRAIFQLVNGAKIEMAERSEVSISRNWSGTSVQVERGHIIVNAPEAGRKAFSVSAGDVRIPVRNAVFSLNHGIKGSRVAVAKGFAHVEGPDKTYDLNAGQECATGYRLVNASLTSEFAWSQNSEYYLGLLKEFSTLRKQLQDIPSPKLRYSSNLAKYLPENTVVYAAIPNLGGTIDEAKRIFEQRLAESEVLRDWWQQQPAARNGQLDQALTQISSISQYLGDEIILAVGLIGPHQYSQPVFLAEQGKSGLREYLEQSVPAAAGLHIISGTTAASPTTSAENGLFVSLDNGVVIASPNTAELQTVAATVSNPSADRFPQTAFYKRIAQSYSIGAGYLLAIDMEQMVTKSVVTPKEIPPGFNNAQYLVLEKRDTAGDSETRASLSFAGAREGIASWLGAPGPMGSLDFVSPDANFAAAVVMKNPLSIVQEMIGYVSQAEARNGQHTDAFQKQLGVTFASEVAATLGGDATFAVDGPLLPVPSWKLAAEVYDAHGLQNAIADMVNRFNQNATANTGRLQLKTGVVNSRTFYSLQNDKNPNFIAYYTFVDGYLLAGSSPANLLQAISNREAGNTLVSSTTFRNHLPGDSYPNFSAILYHNAGKSLGSAANQLKASGALSDQQKQALAALAIGSGPGLICVYGEPDRIVAASKGGFLGFNLGTLAGIGQGRPMLPLVASGARSSIAPSAEVKGTRF
jgi:FecR protein/Putative zinc-finger